MLWWLSVTSCVFCGKRISPNKAFQFPTVRIHTLLEHRVPPRLADDEIGPLHDHDGDEERRVAGVLEDFAIPVSPFLSVRVLEVIDGLRIPGLPQTGQVGRQEAIFSQYDCVDEETSTCLKVEKFPCYNLIGHIHVVTNRLVP